MVRKRGGAFAVALVLLYAAEWTQLLGSGFGDEGGVVGAASEMVDSAGVDRNVWAESLGRFEMSEKFCESGTADHTGACESSDLLSHSNEEGNPNESAAAEAALPLSHARMEILRYRACSCGVDFAGGTLSPGFLR